MGRYYDLKEIITKIKDLKKTAIELKTLSHRIPAIDINVDRILSNVRILEINVSEVADVLED
jgi:hypothetical protein